MPPAASSMSPDVILTRSSQIVSTGSHAFLRTVQTQRRERAQWLLLSRLDDSLLDDIGISRAQIAAQLRRHRLIAVWLRRALPSAPRDGAATDTVLFVGLVGAGLVALVMSF